MKLKALLLMTWVTSFTNLGVTASNHSNKDPINKRNAALGDISFSYAATDLGSDNGLHVKTITVIKNYALPSLDKNKTHERLSESRTHSEEYWPHKTSAKIGGKTSDRFVPFDISSPDEISKTGPVQFPLLNFPKRINDFVANAKFFEYQSTATKAKNVTENYPSTTKASKITSKATTPKPTTPKNIVNQEIKKISAKISAYTAHLPIPRPKTNRNRTNTDQVKFSSKKIVVEQAASEDKPLKIVVDHLSLSTTVNSNIVDVSQESSTSSNIVSTVAETPTTEKPTTTKRFVPDDTYYNEIQTIQLLPSQFKNSYALSRMAAAIARGDIARVKELANELLDYEKQSLEPSQKIKYIFEEHDPFIASQPIPVNAQYAARNTLLYPMTTAKPYLSPNVRNLVPIVVGEYISQPNHPNLIQFMPAVSNPSTPIPVPIQKTSSKPYQAPKLVSTKKLRQRRNRYSRPRK